MPESSDKVIRYWCKDCKKEFSARWDPLVECPSCHGSHCVQYEVVEGGHEEEHR